MKLILNMLIAGAAGVALGYFIAQQGDKEVPTALAMDRAVADKLNFTCKSKSYAAIFEAGPLTKAFAAKGSTDRVSIKIEPEARRISTVMNAAIQNGQFDPADHQIVQNDSHTLVATSFEDRRHVHAFYLDKRNGRLMWTKTSSLLGLMGQSILFECD